MERVERGEAWRVEGVNGGRGGGMEYVHNSARTVHDGISREVLSTPVHHTPDAAL